MDQSILSKALIAKAENIVAGKDLNKTIVELTETLNALRECLNGTCSANQSSPAQKIITEAENILAGKAPEMTEQEFLETLQAIAEGVQNGTLAWQEREDGEQDLVTVH